MDKGKAGYAAGLTLFVGKGDKAEHRMNGEVSPRICALGKKIKSSEDVELFALELMNELRSENIILTLGEEGMLIFENHNGSLKKIKIPTKARKVADVSGAGDTVISTIAVCLAGGASLEDAAIISNYAAGLVVEEVGIVPVYKDKLISHIAKEQN